jgi:segregation and condensation protein A
MTTYELKLANYTGPLQKLLELIEERKLDISEISLAQVTDDFLRYLEKMEKMRAAGGGFETQESLRLLADFVVIASRLVFIKSKALLPDLTLSPEEEESIKDLEVRLRLYRELKPAMKNILRLWRERKEEFSRPYFMNFPYLSMRPEAGAAEKNARIFFPGNVSVELLLEGMRKMWQNLSGLIEESRIIQEKIATLEDTIREVVKRLKELREVSFTKLAYAKSRAEIIVTFLAILHLAREQIIFLEQGEHFSDIIVRQKKI